MKAGLTTLVIIAWVILAGAVFSPEERQLTDTTLASTDSVTASGVIFGNLLLWILFIMLSVIIGKITYDTFSKKTKK